MTRRPHPHYERVPALRRDLLPLRTQVWRHFFPPSYRTVPWPIPDDWGREWQRRSYLRSLGIRPESITGTRSPLELARDVAVTAAACAVVVAALTAASRVWAWGHL